MVTIAVGTFGGVSALPIEVAREEGLFQRAGLDVRGSVTAGSGDLRDALVSGEVAVVHCAPDNVIAWADGGAEVRAWLAGAAGPISLLARGFERVADLSGRRIGVDSPRSGFAPILRGLLEAGGLPAEEVEVVAIGATRLRYRALLDGDVDATLLTLPWSLLAARAGASTLGSHPDVAPALLTSCGASLRGWLASKRDVALAYAGAVDAAVAWLRAPVNTERATARLADEADLEADVAREILDTMRGPLGWPAASLLHGDELRPTWELRTGALERPAADPTAYVETVGTP